MCAVAACHDVVVVGGGLSGSYAAWRLRDSGLSVHLFEHSHRVGGLMHSIENPRVADVIVDVGVTSLDLKVSITFWTNRYCVLPSVYALFFCSITRD